MKTFCTTNLSLLATANAVENTAPVISLSLDAYTVAPFAGPISATEMGFDGWNRATWSHILTPNHQFRRTTGI